VKERVSRPRRSGLNRSRSNRVTLVRRRGRSGRFEPTKGKTDFSGCGDRGREQRQSRVSEPAIRRLGSTEPREDKQPRPSNKPHEAERRSWAEIEGVKLARMGSIVLGWASQAAI